MKEIRCVIDPRNECTWECPARLLASGYWRKAKPGLLNDLLKLLNSSDRKTRINAQKTQLEEISKRWPTVKTECIYQKNPK